MARRDRLTPDLFDWQPPRVAVGFEPEQLAGNRLGSKISRAVALALRECGLPRAEVAARMSEELGFPVSADMLDAYASEAKESHRITLERFVALITATGCHDLLGFVAGLFGHVERAGRFLYLQRLAFGGKVTGQSFGVDPNTAAGFNLTRLEPLLADVHERLAGVVIENLDWLAFLDRYDRPGTLFYLDPPYFNSEGDYGKDLFDRSQFELMAERLARLRGRFILSINDVPEIRALFGRFACESVKLIYSIRGGKGVPARELIVSGGAT